jgi:chemotaxis protein methyltransferase CheR
MGAIGQAADRIAQLAHRAEAPAPRPRAWDAEDVLAPMREERFDDAMKIALGTPDLSSNAEALVLLAALLTNKGDLSGAEDACGRVLAIDPQNAGAHYLAALCREHAGDVDAAAQRDEMALYLDPEFAMPRLHLGLLAKRAGKPDVARRELSRAAPMLASEPTRRVLVFGGGFSREALVQLCESELRTCPRTR